MKRKITALICTVVLGFASMPVSALAAEQNFQDQTDIPNSEEAAELQSQDETAVTGAAVSSGNDYLSGSGIYSGIEMDGSFGDWSGIGKTAVSHQNFDSVAVVWDGDYIYLFVKEKAGDGNHYSLTWNTYFQFNSDHGVTASFRAYRDGSEENPAKLRIQGVNGASGIGRIIDNASYWELKFPASMLGTKINTVSLNWQYGDPIISGIENLSPKEEEETPVVPGGGSVSVDGSYSEWDSIPHGEITWTGSGGTCNNNGALFLEGETLYAHLQAHDLFRQQMPVKYMELTVNQKKIPITVSTVTANNEIGWGNVTNLPVGTTMLGVFFNDYPKRFFGNAAVTVYQADHSKGGEIEFAVSLEALSEISGIPVESMKEFKLYNPGLGKDIIVAQGTSTGPVVGIVICFSATAGCYFYKKRKQKGSICTVS